MIGCQDNVSTRITIMLQNSTDTDTCTRTVPIFACRIHENRIQSMRIKTCLLKSSPHLCLLFFPLPFFCCPLSTYLRSVSPPSPFSPATMARLAPASQTNPHETLFQQFLPRYLRHPAVRIFLMDHTQPPAPTFSSSLSSSLSYACMYYPPTSASRRAPTPPPVPQPFLDTGDFMLCDHVYDGIAVGHLYNQNQHHPLALLRDRMLGHKRLSNVPTARKFAVDLSVSNLEIIEFAWMADHSLIIACRRLDPIIPTVVNQHLVLSGDLLFYDIIPYGMAPGVPLLRMTLSEKPAICQFCGTRGIKTCACPSAFKTRAPSTSSVPIPFSHSQFTRDDDTNMQTVPQGPLAANLATWEYYTRRIFNTNTSGNFFVNWYKRSDTLSGMKLFISPSHPISYHFICGTRKQTMTLACMYVKQLRLCERACAADARLYAYLSTRPNTSTFMYSNQSSSPPAAELQLDDSGGNTHFGVDASRSAQNDLEVLPSSFASVDCNASGGSSSSILSSGKSDDISDDFSNIIPTVQSNVFDASFKSSTDEDPVIQRPDSAVHAEMITPIFIDPQNLVPNNSVDASILFENLSPVTADKNTDAIDVADIAEDASDACTSAPQREAEISTPQNSKTQRLTLSTSSREIQQYMTVDAFNTPTCKECGSSFPKRGNLARHIQTVHLKLKPFQCEQCLASFGYKNHLKRHQIVHEKAKGFKCRVCDQVFKGQTQLSKHVQQIHRQNAEDETKVEDPDKTRVSCDVCGGKSTEIS